MPKVSEILFGSKDKVKQLPTKSPMQMELSNLISEGLKSGSGPFADLFSKFNKEEFEQGVAQPEIKRYQEEILPNIIEKFIGRGSVRGSGFQRNVLKSGTDLSSRLAELMYNAQNQQKQNRIAGLGNVTGQQQFENVLQPGSKGLVQQAIGAASPSIAKVAERGLGDLYEKASKWIAG